MKTFLIKDTSGRGITARKVGVSSVIAFASSSNDKEDVEKFAEHADVGDALHLEDENVLISRTHDRDDSTLELLKSSSLNKGMGFQKIRFEESSFQIKHSEGLYSVVVGNFAYQSPNPFHVVAEMIEAIERLEEENQQ